MAMMFASASVLGRFDVKAMVERVMISKSKSDFIVLDVSVVKGFSSMVINGL